jgi:ubiquinone/menaquinone biosynthesis C-methylase UbiE
MPASRDIFQSLHQADAETLERIVTRMEERARDARFVQMRGAYLDLVQLQSARTFLDLGCGTGIDARAAALRPEFKGVATGVDLSPGMIAAGEKLAAEEGIADRVLLRVGDAAATGLPSGSMDVVVMHTLISHVIDQGAVLKEAARLLGPRGRLLVFDADFASLAFSYPDTEVAAAMEAALLETFVANPRATRDLPSLLPSCGLRVETVQSHILADAGTTTFFVGMLENYAPLVPEMGLQPRETADAWLEEQRRAIAGGTFFGSLNFHAYLLRRLS